MKFEPNENSRGKWLDRPVLEFFILMILGLCVFLTALQSARYLGQDGENRSRVAGILEKQ